MRVKDSVGLPTSKRLLQLCEWRVKFPLSDERQAGSINVQGLAGLDHCSGRFNLHLYGEITRKKRLPSVEVSSS